MALAAAAGGNAAAGTSASGEAAAAVEAPASRANKRKQVPLSTADTAAKKKESKNKKGSIQGAEAVELELVESGGGVFGGGGGGHVGGGNEYLGDIEFLFSHIRQTLKVFALSDVSASASSAGSIGGPGKQAERFLKDAKDAEVICAQFTCCTITRVQILTPEELRAAGNRLSIFSKMSKTLRSSVSRMKGGKGMERGVKGGVRERWVWRLR